MPVFVVEDERFFKYWKETGRPYADFVKDYGFDFALYRDTPGLWMGRWTINWSAINMATLACQGQPGPYLWIPREDSKVISAYDRDSYRYVLARTSWDENGSWRGGYQGSREDNTRGS